MTVLEQCPMCGSDGPSHLDEEQSTPNCRVWRCFFAAIEKGRAARDVVEGLVGNG